MSNKKKSRLIIVSNRLPIVVKNSVEDGYRVSHASGGLVTAMTPVLKRDGGIWIGWAGNYLEENIDVEELLEQEMKSLNYRYKSVDINLSDYERYYKGFSNEVLWPLFHNVSIYCNFEASYYEAYKRVNQKFAQTIKGELIDDDFIWIHDYHLINTAKELREMGVKNKIAFFLHIPFPPSETFNRIPWRLEIVEAILSYDLVGFQTDRDKKNFLEVVSSLIDDAVVDKPRERISKILTHKGKYKVGAFPISIDYDEFYNQANSEEVSKMAHEIKNGYPGQKIMLGVDRLDYTKGLPQRLKAYKRLLEKYPRLRKKIKLVQVMVPSREDISKYTDLKREIERLVGEINGKFSKPGWIPIQYCYTSLERTELLAYYRVADIALVTPLKDGMNLVAKEYCVANIDKSGVLILSEFAGASQQFKDDALLVNPFDEESIVDTIKVALSMKKKEKKKRMENMQNIVKEFDIYWWVDTFLKDAKQ
ncbi:MAG: trehalose-6-phosphate synthase [Sulfurimonas sp.]|nr:trehalose-6-phosphate synthase [Sulfurimonas sp.]